MNRCVETTGKRILVHPGRPSGGPAARSFGKLCLPAVIVCVALSTSTPWAQPSDPPPDPTESAAGDPELSRGAPAEAGGNPQLDRVLLASDADSTDRPYWRTNLFGRFFRDQKYLVTTWWPSEFRRPAFRDSLLAGVLVAGSSSASAEGGLDLELEQYIKKKSSGRANRSWRRASDLGNVGPAAVLIGAGYLFGRWTHHDQLAEASSLSAEALLSSGLYCMAIKSLSARTRPASGGMGDFFEYRPDSGQVGGSFPSGHATGAFTVATVFAEVYSDHPWVSWAAYGTAGLVGISRISLGRHFPSDVLVGAILGHSVGQMAVARQRGSRETVARLEPFVDLDSQEAGVVWVRRW
jgi:undecaprenyl-diphosphatase